MEKLDIRYNFRCKWTMFGKLISQERAQTMLPMLVERANERKTMSYGELAKHFNLAWAMPIMPAVICTTGTLYLLERNGLPERKFDWTHGKIPRISNMVTRAKGKPAGWVAEQLELQNPPIEFQTLLDEIFDYNHWDEVLKALGLRT